MSRLSHSIQSYLRYRFLVRSRFDLHSPFIFTFWDGILRDRNHYPEYDLAEGYRKALLADQRVIRRTDLGAGSGNKGKGSLQTTVKKLANRSLVGRKEAKFLFRLSRQLKPLNILELGTSLGLSGFCLSAGSPSARIISIEGCSETASIAAENLLKSGMRNIKLLNGSFADKLPEALKEMPSVDLVFMDGDHRKQPTLDYFETIYPHLHSRSVVVIDDIHWSRGMEEAWRDLLARPGLKVSIDLYQLGLMYFREELSKEDFVLRF